MKNARFWTWVNDGFVKITLTPGQSLTHESGGPTEEGWWYSSTTWETHDDEHIRRKWSSEARDCDGRMDRYGDDICHVNELMFHDAYSDPTIQLPNWVEERAYQRDHTAESMGY